MEKNQNGQGSQHSDPKSKVETFSDGTQKKETNPNNPTANRNKEQGSQQPYQKEQQPTSKSTSETDVIEAVDPKDRTGKTDSKQNESRDESSGDQKRN